MPGSVPVRIGSGHRIIAGATPRVAPADAADAQPAAAQQPVLFQSIERVFRAGRKMAAARPEHGRDRETVQPDQPGDGAGGPASAPAPCGRPGGRSRMIRANAFARSVNRASNEHVRIAGVADPSAGSEADADLLGRAPRPRLQHERRRGPAAARPRHGEELAAPLEPDHSDLRGPAYAQAESVAVWRRSAGQALAPFGTPPREHATPADGRHARAETVPPLADDVARLICAFHDGAFRQPFAKPKRRV